MTYADTPPGTLDRDDRIVATVTSWSGVTSRPGDYGATDFFVGKRSIGHIHGGYQADIPFPRRIRDQLVAAGRTGPHHIHPDSGWTTRYMRSEADADEVIDLLRINYDRITTPRS